jgi:hypothetical protein
LTVAGGAGATVGGGTVGGGILVGTGTFVGNTGRGVALGLRVGTVVGGTLVIGALVIGCDNVEEAMGVKDGVFDGVAVNVASAVSNTAT